MNKKNNLISAKIKKHDANLKSFRCPNCEHIITVENKLTKKMFLFCPSCGQKNIFKKPMGQQENKGFYYFKNFLYQTNINTLVIGLIFALTGLILLFMQNPYATKLSITLLIIAVIFPLFIIKETQKISMQMTFGIIFFIIFLFLLTGVELEIFLVLIFLGILFTKTIFDEYITKNLKIRMNFFIIIFFIIFIIIITKRIISLLNI